MKPTATLFLVLVLFASDLAIAQSDAMKGMDMKGMETKGMEIGKKAQSKAHKATGMVKKIDRASGTVTIAHEPVASMNWPPMTMSFAVRNKALFGKFAPDKKVEFEFVQRGSDYVITSAK